MQIESVCAIENTEAIANVEGADGRLGAPADLSASIGPLLRLGEPAVQAAIARVLAAGQATGKSVGIGASVVEPAQRYLDQGMNLLAVGGNIGLMMQAGRERLEHFRGKV